jgi:hypothetical protein
MQEVVVLQRQLQALADVLAKPRIDGDGVAAAEHQIGAARGQVLEHRVVLGDLDRIVGRDQRHRGAEDDPRGQRRDVGQQGGGRGGEERRVVMLTDREHVQPDVVGAPRDLDDRPNPLRFTGGGARDRVPRDVADREDSELHRATNLSQS